MDLVILNQGQKTRTKPELLEHTIGRTFGLLYMTGRATGPINGSSMESSGFEPGTLRPQGRDFTTSPSRPLIKSIFVEIKFTKTAILNLQARLLREARNVENLLC
ncbi:hypothetical protein AVEN_209957-1 [Araneus ventricosus]|uniref:Uncharacterized protein n=1 Tax=Araneus ventricosus TaxID=182803 RepID=A0A4Y2DDF9_ARAVE|nr:hypothetical protein AVEN_209957-1 [Araneus ventricosus]